MLQAVAIFIYECNVSLKSVNENLFFNPHNNPRRHISIPIKNDKFDKCTVYDVNWTDILKNGTVDPDPTWSVKKCNRWEFNYTDVPYETIATQVRKKND